jgi:hypothetical protein
VPLAAVHPKAVEITEAGWRFYVDEHVKIGTFSCSVHRPQGIDSRAKAYDGL